MLAGAVLAFVGCGERAPVEPLAVGPRYDLIALSGNLALLRCAPLPADTAAQSVGPAGGVLQVGPHQLTIPPEALDSVVVITAVMPTDTINRVQLEPHGLSFNRKVSLQMSYANCEGPVLLLPKKVVYTDGTFEILEQLPSLDDFFGRQVTGKLKHFSDYAIAW